MTRWGAGAEVSNRYFDAIEGQQQRPPELLPVSDEAISLTA
ncbi:hypothetical protein ACEYW6_14940 [Nostoc sp. UIC 10607]